MKRILFLIVLVIVVGVSIRDNAYVNGETAEKGVKDFVERMYEITLFRLSEEEGFEDWVGKLIKHDIDGAAIAKGFIHSEEFGNSNITNREYVSVMYRAFLDIEAEPEGKQNWINTMSLGYDRDFVMQQFVNSNEFTELCNRFGIERGVIKENGNPVCIEISRFVKRIFGVVYDSEYNLEEYCYWAIMIDNKEMMPGEVAEVLLESEYYMEQCTSDEEYIYDLYFVFLNRTPGTEELKPWIDSLAGGASRKDIRDTFVQSEEYENLLKFYWVPTI